MLNKADESQNLKVSFRSKTNSVCPICGTSHTKEELLSGGGRLIAGKLTAEFRREYIPSKRYGIIHPMAYAVLVCPACLFASYSKDFVKINDPEEINKFKKTKQHRLTVIKTLFGDINFTKDRNLVSGLASYVLAVDCYMFRSKNLAPTAKRAISALRAAWMSDDLFVRADYRPYDKLRDYYYKIALEEYRTLLVYMQSGEEPMDNVAYMLGPDLDHNWAYDGILYLNGYLIWKYYKEVATDKSQQATLLRESQRCLSKIYGLGKASLAKPAEIVNKSKELYTEVGILATKLEAEIAEQG